jgi:hypothetical protein
MTKTRMLVLVLCVSSLLCLDSMVYAKKHAKPDPSASGIFVESPSDTNPDWGYMQYSVTDYLDEMKRDREKALLIIQAESALYVFGKISEIGYDNGGKPYVKMKSDKNNSYILCEVSEYSLQKLNGLSIGEKATFFSGSGDEKNGNVILHNCSVNLDMDE